METLRLINAGSLALATLGREWVGDDQPTAAVLSVQADQPAVAMSRLRTLGRLLAPRLALHADLRLCVTTGMTPPDDAALALTEGLGDAGRDLQVAALKGEDRIGLVEELLAEGLISDDPYRAGPGPAPQFAGALLAAWGEVPSGSLLAPLSAGAVCVLSRGATPDAFACAASPSLCGEPLARFQPAPSTDPEHAPMWLAFKGPFVAPLPEGIASVLDGRPGLLPAGVVRLQSETSDELQSADRDALVEALRRLELIDATDLAAPLERSLTQPLLLTEASAPRARVEADPIAFDLRTAAEWRE